MTKIDPKKYEELKNAIYLSKHQSAKNIEEAMRSELGFGCEIILAETDEKGDPIKDADNNYVCPAYRTVVCTETTTGNGILSPIKKVEGYCFKFAVKYPHACEAIPEGRYVNSKFDKIIGQPITLENVMVAMDKFAGNYFIDETGCFVKAHRKEFNYDYIIRDCKNIKWILNKDLDNQSEPLKQFLINLLVK